MVKYLFSLYYKVYNIDIKTKINIYVIKGFFKSFKSSFFFRGQDSLIKSDAFSPIIIF